VTISDYLEGIKERLITDAAVVSFRIGRERATLMDGYIRARLAFADQSYLEFSEYVQLVDGEIKVATYSYHWANSQDDLIMRWDNTPHFPKLSNFPHHIHHGQDVLPGQPVDIFLVLDEIGRIVASG
jgi:hypothetical protein